MCTDFEAVTKLKVCLIFWSGTNFKLVPTKKYVLSTKVPPLKHFLVGTNFKAGDFKVGTNINIKVQNDFKDRTNLKDGTKFNFLGPLV